MSNRTALLSAARRASEILNEFEAKKRIADGYTRIDAELIANSSNVVVLYRKLEQLLGGFLREEGSPGIIVNWDRPRGLVHMTCAHELGHFALDHSSTSDVTVDIDNKAALIEQQANKFAYALLAPSWLVAMTMRQKKWSRENLRHPSIVYQLSLRLGMSYKAMVWSLVGLGHLSALDAGRICDITPISIKRNALAGNTPDQSKKDVWILGPSDRDRILEASIGDQFILELPNHAGSGHLWTIDQVQSEGFTIEPFYREASKKPAEKNSPIVIGGDGTPIRYEMRVPLDKLNKPSEDQLNEVRLMHLRHRITLQENAPWKSQPEAIDHFALNAEFEELKDGLSQYERTRRLIESRRT
jgi:Zn-dependent peptidase ImmA (M78 family)